MNGFEQFKGLLNSLDDGESKTSLMSAFNEVTNIFNDAISSRDTVKAKLNESKELIGSLGNTLGLKDGFTVEDVKAHVDGLSNTSKLDELKQNLTKQHETELNELRTMLDTEKQTNQDLTNKANDLLFSSAIANDGLLTGFVDNPKMRGLVESELKSKLLFEDGNIYVRNENGEKAKDITSGNYLTPSSIVESMKSSEDWKGFLSPQTQGKNGSGMQSNQARGEQHNKADLGGDKQSRINAIQQKLDQN